MATAAIRKGFSWAALALLLAQVPAFAQDRSAETFLRSIYGKAYIGKDANGVDVSTRANLDRYFVPELAAKIDADGAAAAKRGDIGELDGDPFVGAQDWQIKSFDISVRNVDAETATGTIRFSNSGMQAQITVALKRLKTGWRIQDIDWGEGGKLSSLFKPR
jgi:Protein of unknown function (DUF3828)